MKKCSKCKQEKDNSEFNRDSQKRDGYHSSCRECEHILWAKRSLEKKQRERIELPDDYTKTCIKCNKTKHKNEFNIDKYTTDGICVYCRDCKIKLKKEKYYKNVESTRCHQRDYYLENKIRILNHCKKYREMYKDRIKIIKSEKSKLKSKHFNGVLDLHLSTARGVITEYIVSEVLGDCENCNKKKFNSVYDLISENYGTIDVKSSILYKTNKNCSSYCWSFQTRNKQIKPDEYVCIGFDKNIHNIERVWIIPGDSKLFSKWALTVTNSTIGLQRAAQYEVDPTPYNEAYQNLDIYSLDEFRNLNCESSVTA